MAIAAAAVPSRRGATVRKLVPRSERRAQILRTAASLFAQHGFAGTTTRQVAAAVGTSETVLFRHFPTKDALYGVGHYQIVALNGGTRQGVENGHVFSVFRPGPMVDDRTGYRYGSFAAESEVRLPEMYHGVVMVFRTFDDISYAMVMGGDNLIREFDRLRHPDERS